MTNERSRRVLTLAGWGVSLCVAAVVLATLIAVVGSPLQARKKKADEQRETDLSGIVQTVREYNHEHGKLPTSLSQLTDWRWLPGSPKDPVTGADYPYQTDGPKRFKLGAVFETDTTKDQTQRNWRANDSEAASVVTRHKQGQVWFTFNSKS
jgi:type II secretory pathway pseudopilin PulG